MPAQYKNLGVTISPDGGFGDALVRHLEKLDRRLKAIVDFEKYLMLLASSMDSIVFVFYAEVFMELWKELRDNSPIDSGFYRANWQISPEYSEDKLYEGEYKDITWIFYKEKGTGGNWVRRRSKVQGVNMNTKNSKVKGIWPSYLGKKKMDRENWYSKLVYDTKKDGIPEKPLIPKDGGPNTPALPITPSRMTSGGVWVFNNSDHATEVVNGSSFQAPDGGFEISLLTVQKKMHMLAMRTGFKLS